MNLAQSKTGLGLNIPGNKEEEGRKSTWVIALIKENLMKLKLENVFEKSRIEFAWLKMRSRK